MNLRRARIVAIALGALLTLFLVLKLVPLAGEAQYKRLHLGMSSSEAVSILGPSSEFAPSSWHCAWWHEKGTSAGVIAYQAWFFGGTTVLCVGIDSDRRVRYIALGILD